MVKGLFIQINQHSFIKNKIVLNYHRSLALCLFAIFDGKISQLNLQNVSGCLSISEEELI